VDAEADLGLDLAGLDTSIVGIDPMSFGPLENPVDFGDGWPELPGSHYASYIEKWMD